MALLSLKKLLASSLLTKSQFACSLAAAASPSTLFTTNNRRRDSPVGRAFPLSDVVVVNDTIFTPPSPIRLASPLSNGIGGGVRSGWEARRSYSILNGLGNEEDVKVPFQKKKSFTKICMVVKTFEKEQTFPAHQHKISLPTKRSLFTVLRSPHVHKKSREQFFLTTKKQHLVIQAERHELAKKYFWLKRHRIMGAQFEVKFFCKTRFQLARGTDGLNDSRESELRIEPSPALASI
uniref:Mitochondrial ribosomal protein S10 n=1 Tax=Dystaenia ibukiensis TaxID=76001 RepID=A0AAF0Z405_9APIA|nr:mitochondrial ribosomal protein S10 [Dystaenia ibukiensis]